jgi:hypothetical protein
MLHLFMTKLQTILLLYRVKIGCESSLMAIRCELGVHKHIFHALIAYLQNIGHTHSRYVTLKEQLAIFLYKCVTGLSVRHVGERFQRSNDTISRYGFLTHYQIEADH